MIVGLVLVGIVIAGWYSNSITLFLAAMCYAGIHGTHHLAFADLPASSFAPYYLSAMSAELITIGSLCAISGGISSDRVLYFVGVIAALSMLNNMYGLVLWEYRAPIESFNVIGFTIYAAMLVVLAGSRHRDRMAGIYSDFNLLRRALVRRFCVGEKG